MEKIVERNDHKVSYTKSPNEKWTDSSRNYGTALLLIEESQRIAAHFPYSTLIPAMPRTNKREKTSVLCVTIPRNASWKKILALKKLRYHRTHSTVLRGQTDQLTQLSYFQNFTQHLCQLNAASAKWALMLVFSTAVLQDNLKVESKWNIISLKNPWIATLFSTSNN